VWSDEFDGALGTPIDATKWTFDTGILNVNNEVEYYCAPTTTSGGCRVTEPNAYLDGSGHLILQATKTGNSTAAYSGSWTSARMTTNGTEQFLYGRVESRMMLPVGAGIWPAFWALGANVDGNHFGNAVSPWPDCGEMDYMENVPERGGLGVHRFRSTLHQKVATGLFSRGQTYAFPDGDVTAYHVYGAVWSPNMVQFYLDDPAKVFFVHTAAGIPPDGTFAFNHSFFLLLNLAIGGDGSWPGPTDASTPNPAVMTVDYVRLYRPSVVPAPQFSSPAAIVVKAGATTGNRTALSVREPAGSGRVFLSCSTDAPEAACAVMTTDALNSSTLDFSASSVGTATVTVVTSAKRTATWRLAIRARAWRPTAVAALVAALLAMLVSTALPRRRVLAVLGGVALVSAGLLLDCAAASNRLPPTGRTAPGNYKISVHAYTVSGDGAAPDATVRIPLTVN